MSKTKWHNNLIWQPFLAVLYVAVVLWVLSFVDSSQLIWAVGAGALSSSSCIVFSTPQNCSGNAKHLIGGYIIGALVGVCVHFVMSNLMPLLSADAVMVNSKIFWALASISVGVTVVLMAKLDMFHPPAVGLSLVLVLDIHHYEIIAVILLAVVALASLRHFLNPYLKNLVVVD